MNLYKIVTLKQWNDSQQKEYLVVGSMDQEFIHFAEEENYLRIGEKFFKGQEVMILLLESSKLDPNQVTFIMA
ncbi:MAG: DUF952 domain-containing protein [Oligoflexales bacterium]|nr:DUF952 domain-containing protein [Oligoflexales bacterium]